MKPRLFSASHMKALSFFSALFDFLNGMIWFDKTGVIKFFNYPFWGDQTVQIHVDFEGFIYLIFQCMVWGW